MYFTLRWEVSGTKSSCFLLLIVIMLLSAYSKPSSAFAYSSASRETCLEEERARVCLWSLRIGWGIRGGGRGRLAGGEKGGGQGVNAMLVSDVKSTFTSMMPIFLAWPFSRPLNDQLVPCKSLSDRAEWGGSS